MSKRVLIIATLLTLVIGGHVFFGTDVDRSASAASGTTVPTSGMKTQGFRWNNSCRWDGDQRGYCHGGIDIAGPKTLPGGAVYAMAAGKVVTAGRGSFGCEVIIDHGDQGAGIHIYSLYGHMGRGDGDATGPGEPECYESYVKVSAGQSVSAGQLIGSQGNAGYAVGTGSPAGVHLHFSVLRGTSPAYRKAIDPAVCIGNTGSYVAGSQGLACLTSTSGGPNYSRFLLQTGTALGLHDPGQLEFVAGDVNRDGYVDIIAIKESQTGTGKVEAHVLNGATNFTTFLLQTGTALGLHDPGQLEFVAGDVNRDGYVDIIAIKESQTGTGKVEAHVLSGATNFTTFLLQTGTALGLHDPGQLEFVAGDVNRDGYVDIIAMKESQTGTGKVEAHVLNGATNFSTFLLQTGTALGLHDPGQLEFVAGDVNRDGYVDIIAMKESQTGTGKVEAHVLNGATNFSTFLLQTGTALGLHDPGQLEFVAGDVNRDGYVDIIAIKESQTGTGKVEVHVLG